MQITFILSFQHSLLDAPPEGFSLAAAALPEGICILCLTSLIAGAAERPTEEAQQQQQVG